MLFLGIDDLRFNIALRDAILDAHLSFFFIFSDGGSDILRIPWRLRRNISKHNIGTHLFLVRVTDDDQAFIITNPEKFPVEFPKYCVDNFFVPRGVWYHFNFFYLEAGARKTLRGASSISWIPKMRSLIHTPAMVEGMRLGDFKSSGLR
jgi:hypothetical protein